MSSAARDAAARREVVDALQRLLVERQEHVLRLEALTVESGALRQRLAELAEEQEALTQRLTALVGPPADAPLSAPNEGERSDLSANATGTRA